MLRGCEVDNIDSVPIKAQMNNALFGDKGAPNLKNKQADEAVMCASDAVTSWRKLKRTGCRMFSLHYEYEASFTTLQGSGDLQA